MQVQSGVVGCARSMLLPALVPIAATFLGTALGLGARRWHAVVEPVRGFALAAVTVTIVLHLMPEAVEEAGPWALAVLAAGLLLPSALGWLGARHKHTSIAVELTFAGVIAHQIGDGLALGAVTADGGAHWDFLLAIGAHTVPLAAVVAMTIAERDGRRAAIARAVLIALAPLVGLAIGRAGGGSAEVAPWLNAAVSGLLLHVLAHDLPSAPARTTGMRTAELVAIAAGIVLPLAGGLDHDHGGHDFPRIVAGAIADVAQFAAPALLVGFLAGGAIHAAARRSRVRWIAGGRGPVAALRGAVLGVPLPPCSCDIVPVAGDLRAAGGGAGFVTAFVLAAPELNLAALLLTAGFLGWETALIRIGAVVVIATVAALVVERIAGERAAAPAEAELPPGPRSFLDSVDDHVAHDGAWIAVGLTIAGFVTAAVATRVISGDAFASTWTHAVVLALAVPATVSATAATPIAFALMFAGLPLGVTIAAALLASMVNLRTLDFVRRSWGPRAALAATAAVVLLAAALAAAVDGSGLRLSPIDLPGWLELAAGAGLAGLAAASLWRHGLAHWLAALRGSDHGHEHDHRDDHGHHDHHGAH